uniref:Ferric siderophore transport system periplasmic-binding protein TonB n=1 Tax=Vitiosangium cumulatum TaxID=1867796 RepID=A0A7D4XHH0_9BACT|nr:ferric siderophore transport system periplasmic-binding protein TonB [Vitiosangium cumulatum]
MTGWLHSENPRFAVVCLLAACAALGSTGCATTARATTSTVTAPEPVAAPAPAPEPAPAPVVRAEKPKAARRTTPRPAPEAKKPEAKTLVSARTPEPRRPQDSASASLGASEPLPFDPGGMTRPQRVSGRDPQLTPEAQAQRVRGTALVRCVVTREGRVTNCRLLNGLPYMEQELLEALSTWRVTPVMAQGKPLDVDYTFVVRIPTG